MSELYAKRLRGWRFIVFNGCVGASHALVIFNAGAYIAMLPRVAGGLGIPLSFAAWSQTDYMMFLALGFPVGGWLSRRLGEYRPFMASFLLFALASWLCASATTLYPYLAGRMLLGFTGGLSLPLGQSLLIKEYPKQRKSIGIGVWSIFTLTPFTLGPPLGGWIADSLGWRWLFWLNIPVALTIAGVVGALLYARGSVSLRHRFDGVGFLLTCLVFLSLQTLLNQGNDWDWTRSLYINGLIVLLLIALPVWVIWTLSVRYPFLDLRLFGRRNFTIGVITLFLGFLMFQGLLSMLIVQLQITLGYSSLLAGLVFLPMAILAKPVSGVFHEIVKRYDARLLASINLLGFAAVYFWLSRFDDATAFDQLFWAKLAEGACLGSFFVPLTTLLLHGLPQERQWRALELANLLRIAAGAIGISLQAIVLYRRTPLHLTRFAENHSAFDTVSLPGVQNLIAIGFSADEAFARFAQLIGQAETIRSLSDAYWLAAWVFLLLALGVWVAHPTRTPARLTPQRAMRRKARQIMGEEV
ncbi:MAG: DHA2 family efflux MFS transporter permease subunit [Methylococcales bacterium]|nr:DHA2 family efflux MFS transporter permease subunit [Methylococcales bacterium]